MRRLIEAVRAALRRHSGLAGLLVPALVLLGGVIFAVAISTWSAPEFPTSYAALPVAESTAGASTSIEVPPAALAATLWDELFPTPPPPPPELPPPKLDLELIAIATVAAAEPGGEPIRRAILYRLDRSELVELAVGQSLPHRDEVTLAALTERAATFNVGDRSVTLELKP